MRQVFKSLEFIFLKFHNVYNIKTDDTKNKNILHNETQCGIILQEGVKWTTGKYTEEMTWKNHS